MPCPDYTKTTARRLQSTLPNVLCWLYYSVTTQRLQSTMPNVLCWLYYSVTTQISTSSLYNPSHVHHACSPAGVTHFARNQNLPSSDGLLGSSHGAEVLCKHGFNGPREGCRGLIMGVDDAGHDLVAFADLTAWFWSILSVFCQNCL